MPPIINIYLKERSFYMTKKNEKITCSHCGAQIDKSANFCTECGKEIKNIITGVSTDADSNVDVDTDSNVNTSTNVNNEIKENITTISNSQTKREEKKVNNKKKTKEHRPMSSTAKTVIISLITFFLGSSLMYGLIYFFPIINDDGEVTSYRNVSITDTGIAESVAKVYDAVVVVESYNNGSLIATGTGFVFETDNDKAYIMTNNHVISGATEVRVTFTNNTTETVTVIGSDTYSDIAVLSIDKSKVISVAELGSSEDMRVGDTTFAVGAPLDYEVYSWSVTRGILSGKDRLVEVSLSGTGTSDYVMNVLQTDTAINSGNSGGPLCNANGEVIGITNMKLASSSIEGMGFAIPIETALEYAESFISGKQIERPYLGISMYDLETNSLFRPNNSSNITEGIYINSVENGSPAAEAGLEAGDIITAIDDVKVSSSAYFRYQLYQHDVGDEIKITYYRNNQEQTTTVKLTSTQPTT